MLQCLNIISWGDDDDEDDDWRVRLAGKDAAGLFW